MSMLITANKTEFDVRELILRESKVIKGNIPSLLVNDSFSSTSAGAFLQRTSAEINDYFEES